MTWEIPEWRNANNSDAITHCVGFNSKVNELFGVDLVHVSASDYQLIFDIHRMLIAFHKISNYNNKSFAPQSQNVIIIIVGTKHFQHLQLTCIIINKYNAFVVKWIYKFMNFLFSMVSIDFVVNDVVLLMQGRLLYSLLLFR